MEALLWSCKCQQGAQVEGGGGWGQKVEKPHWHLSCFGATVTHVSSAQVALASAGHVAPPNARRLETAIHSLLWSEECDF